MSDTKKDLGPRIRAEMMKPEERNEAKELNEKKRKALDVTIREDQAELDTLGAEYEAILLAEDAELKAQGFTYLYDVPRETWVSISRNPLTLFWFDHIDGMYSYCLTIDGKVQHVHASTFVLTHMLNLDKPYVEKEPEEYH